MLSGCFRDAVWLVRPGNMPGAFWTSVLVVMRWGLAVAGNWIGNGSCLIPKKAPTVRAGFLPGRENAELLDVVSDVRQTDGTLLENVTARFWPFPETNGGTTILPYMGHLAA